jgi:hypothetical protein|tara:strand:- start:436 stop:693 length:258 start_codon:yes stop_codon:yes gene_type:complete
VAQIHDIGTPLARHRAKLNALCPRCGAKTGRTHVTFDRGQHPEMPFRLWLNTCTKCGFEGELTGDPEKDKDAKDFWKDKAWKDQP